MKFSTRLRKTLDRAGIVPPPTGYRRRPTGAGKHDSRPNRQRTRGQADRHAIEEAAR